MGPGAQWVSWTHIEDWLAIVDTVLAPTPAFLVRLGAVLLRTDPALALTGRRAVPARLLEAGFAFAHPDLDEALADLRARQMSNF